MSAELEDRSREDLLQQLEDQQAEIEALREELRELEALVNAHGNQLERVRNVLAGEGGFWHLDNVDDPESVIGRLEIAEAKMDGFAQGLQTVPDKEGEPADE